MNFSKTSQLLQFVWVEADKRANNQVGTVLMDTLYIIRSIQWISLFYCSNVLCPIKLMATVQSHKTVSNLHCGNVEVELARCTSPRPCSWSWPRHSASSPNHILTASVEWWHNNNNNSDEVTTDPCTPCMAHWVIWLFYFTLLDIPY